MKSKVQEEYTAVEYDIKLEKATGLCILAYPNCWLLQ